MINSQWLVQVDTLLYRVQQQEQLALQLLYEETCSKIYGIVHRILKNSTDAEDVLQEFYIKVWQQSDKYQGTGTAWGWLSVMARHAALDKLRQTQRNATDNDENLLEIISQINESQQMENRHWLGKCLQQLKPQTRDAILLSYVEGFSHNEISDKLIKPLGTVKAWIRRGLEELKQCLNH